MIHFLQLAFWVDVHSRYNVILQLLFVFVTGKLNAKKSQSRLRSLLHFYFHRICICEYQNSNPREPGPSAGTGPADPETSGREKSGAGQAV
ncbi:hypothetical protein NITGR_800019 [Nitrospina gracilis 3/211]|uniref:Uncharacterized protein n=1 Tax=Nitrospina gracilis (strain 3/211) TaxID=1266370 RepID=M1Z2R1_NITG3|nr:hypothetical protein NITGR_800019 [Nitrospina gracilis 3/211]